MIERVQFSWSGFFQKTSICPSSESVLGSPTETLGQDVRNRPVRLGMPSPAGPPSFSKTLFSGFYTPRPRLARLSYYRSREAATLTMLGRLWREHGESTVDFVALKPSRRRCRRRCRQATGKTTPSISAEPKSASDRMRTPSSNTRHCGYFSSIFGAFIAAASASRFACAAAAASSFALASAASASFAFAWSRNP